MSATSFKSATERILKESERPLTKDEIWEIIHEKGLVQTEGKTPSATLAAQIYIDIKKNPKSPFLLVGKGRFALRNESATSDPKVVVELQNTKIKNDLKKKLQEMDPYQFEFLAGELLGKIGYENVEVTKRSGDGGIDINATLTLDGITDVKTVIQVKRYSNNVQDKVIRELRGSAEVDQRGLVITTAGFTKPAIIEAKAQNKMPVSLVDGERLIELLVKYELGVRKEMIEILSPDDDIFALVNAEKTSSVESKHRSIWPLPGGNLNYVDSLNKFLDFVSKTSSSKADCVQWFLKEFDTVNSEKTASSYTMVPKFMGLVDIHNDKVTLTPDGKEYLKNKNLDFLFETMDKNIYLINEVLGYVKSSDEPVRESDVLEFLNNEYDVGWKSEAQVIYRLLWFANLGKIEKKDGGYV